MLGVVAAIAISYVGPVSGYFDQRAELARQQRYLKDLRAQRDGALRRWQALKEPAVLQTRAHELGYFLPGERPYVVRGLDSHPLPPPKKHSSGGFWDWVGGIF